MPSGRENDGINNTDQNSKNEGQYEIPEVCDLILRICFHKSCRGLLIMGLFFGALQFYFNTDFEALEAATVTKSQLPQIENDTWDETKLEPPNPTKKDASKNIYNKKYTCMPGDDKTEKIKEEVVEDENTSPLYVFGAFVLVTVCVILDLVEYKGTNKQTKAPLSRKCSLADLSVLKHQRKELVRRESILENPEESSNKQMGRMVSRPPLRVD